ncbi:hypothetical protein [Hymenobacter rubripertinctus]|uniref:Phage tail collar domain-containing protein n=1 Tax=Hymenobacter rubripertinctus TaxID=2029981 RepID=A0A418QMI7_9BACT|nr:hypothetical protein [Hymenobacter rubripertinctus]RIY06447.1 hypothetical protein D0T11_18580 [Hymenobacter rubripertinctus]
MLKELISETGGRPFYNDDLMTLQDQLSQAILAPYLSLPWSCVLVGCDVVPTGGGKFNVGWGIAYFNGSIRRFEGASNVSLPAELYLMPKVESSIRAYQTGGSKPCMVESKLGLRPVAGGGLLVTADGVLRVHKAQEAMFRSAGELHALTDFPAEYDNTGKGRYGTKAYGWALANGQNGTMPTGGLFPVGYLSNDTDYGNTKKTGGKKEVKLEVDQMPTHSHNVSSDGQHNHSFSNWQLNFKADRSDSGSREYVPDPGIRNTTFTTAQAGAHSHTLFDTGGGLPHENRPPYMVVAWRQWIGW